MFTYSFQGRTRAATINLIEGLKTRGFATLLFEGFDMSHPSAKLNASLMQEMLPSHVRSKYQKDFDALNKDDTAVRARAAAFCTILCHMLNNAAEPVEENADTRYSYHEERSMTHQPHFVNPKTGKKGFGSDGGDGCIFKIQRYAGVVNSADFVEILVWPSDADCFRLAL